MTIRGKRDTIINMQIPDNLYYDDQKMLQQLIFATATHRVCMVILINK